MEVECKEPPAVKTQKYMAMKTYYSPGHRSAKEKNQGP